MEVTIDCSESGIRSDEDVYSEDTSFENEVENASLWRLFAFHIINLPDMTKYYVNEILVLLDTKGLNLGDTVGKYHIGASDSNNIDEITNAMMDACTQIEEDSVVVLDHSEYSQLVLKINKKYVDPNKLIQLYKGGTDWIIVGLQLPFGSFYRTYIAPESVKPVMLIKFGKIKTNYISVNGTPIEVN